ncbi:glutamate receptor ionotropic, delta-1-like [Haliotis rubra]|uniref:glutamate receptor ionotropic, delta-1-like n=1 Tax=Haliotis rubra TaxID=36100 RepID=UPI001EE5807F|nr:glutamate receptor ionotropic, delta-1-like [Haliotis rubra]
MWTLLFHPDGRAFTDVALCNETENNYGFGHIEVNKRRLFGFSFRVLNLLAQAMNFRIIPPREDDWGKDVNGSWTGVFGMLQRREADLASDILTIHSDRASVADYILPPIGETKQVIIYKKEEEDSDHLLILLRPFQLHVFVSFGVSLITCIIFLSAIRITHYKYEFNNNEGLTGAWTMETAAATASEILGGTLKQGSTVTSSHDSERILVAGWWMFTAIISAVYCGTIMAIFVVIKHNPPFSNMAELVARQDYKIGYDISSITENFLQNSRLPDAMAVKQRVQELSATDPDVFSSNDTKHLQRVWNGKYAYISGMLLTALSNANCKLNVIDTEFGNAFIAFYLPKSSPYKRDFEKSMSYLSDSGVLQRSYQEWFPPTSHDGCPVEDFPKPMSLIKIHSIFFAGGGGVVCSFVILAAEILCNRNEENLSGFHQTQVCHVSRVLIVGASDDLPVLLDSNIQVENVAVLELPSSQTNNFGYGYLEVGKRKVFGFPYRVLSLLAEAMNFRRRTTPWQRPVDFSCDFKLQECSPEYPIRKRVSHCRLDNTGHNFYNI